jgi:hypothetical protein
MRRTEEINEFVREAIKEGNLGGPRVDFSGTLVLAVLLLVDAVDDLRSEIKDQRSNIEDTTQEGGE